MNPIDVLPGGNLRNASDGGLRADKQKIFALPKVCAIEARNMCADIDLTSNEAGWFGELEISESKALRIFYFENSSIHRLELTIVEKETILFQDRGESVSEWRLGVRRFEFSFDSLGKKAGRSEVDLRRIILIVDDDATLKNVFRNSVAGLSYFPVLRHFLDIQAPRSILEWGPGRSTLMMAESAPEAAITAIEHDEKWHTQCLAIPTRFPKVRVEFQCVTLKPGQCGCYVTLPLYSETRYDLILVDGRLRCDCLAIARQVLQKGGVVLLHDAHRQNYRRAFQLYGSFSIECNTAILRK